jgi:hypothetical protein
MMSGCTAVLSICCSIAGPDDRGVWSDARTWLGHRRLSIIDLSPGGHQPMTHAETGVTITFNATVSSCATSRGRSATHSRLGPTPKCCCTPISSGDASAYRA